MWALGRGLATRWMNSVSRLPISKMNLRVVPSSRVLSVRIGEDALRHTELMVKTPCGYCWAFGPERRCSRGDHSDFAHHDSEEMDVIQTHSFDKTLMSTFSMLSVTLNAGTSQAKDAESASGSLEPRRKAEGVADGTNCLDWRTFGMSPVPLEGRTSWAGG